MLIAPDATFGCDQSRVLLALVFFHRLKAPVRDVCFGVKRRGEHFDFVATLTTGDGVKTIAPAQVSESVRIWIKNEFKEKVSVEVVCTGEGEKIEFSHLKISGLPVKKLEKLTARLNDCTPFCWFGGPGPK